MHPSAHDHRRQRLREGALFAIVLALQVSLLFAALQPVGVASRIAALFGDEAPVSLRVEQTGHPPAHHGHGPQTPADERGHSHPTGCQGLGVGLGCAIFVAIPATRAQPPPSEPLIAGFRPLRPQASVRPPLRPPRLLA